VDVITAALVVGAGSVVVGRGGSVVLGRVGTGEVVVVDEYPPPAGGAGWRT